MIEKAEKPAKAVIDWLAVEMHYRAGIRTLESIGKEYGISKGRICQVATKEGWTRDLKAKIHARSEAKVARHAALEELNKQALNDPTKQARIRLVESEVVDANVDIEVNVRLSQRSDIGRGRTLFVKLLAELERETDNLELFSSLGELLDESGPDATGTWRKDKLNETYQKVISQGGRIDSAKKLTEMLERLIKLERQAFGIDDSDQGDSTVDDLLKSLGRKMAHE